MTVKELIEVLTDCNANAQVIIADETGSSDLFESQVWQTPDGTRVVLDPSFGRKV